LEQFIFIHKAPSKASGFVVTPRSIETKRLELLSEKSATLKRALKALNLVYGTSSNSDIDAIVEKEELVSLLLIHLGWVINLDFPILVKNLDNEIEKETENGNQNEEEEDEEEEEEEQATEDGEENEVIEDDDDDEEDEEDEEEEEAQLPAEVELTESSESETDSDEEDHLQQQQQEKAEPLPVLVIETSPTTSTTTTAVKETAVPVSAPAPAPVPVLATGTAVPPMVQKLKTLATLGFEDRSANIRALIASEGDVEKAVDMLVSPYF